MFCQLCHHHPRNHQTLYQTSNPGESKRCSRISSGVRSCFRAEKIANFNYEDDLKSKTDNQNVFIKYFATYLQFYTKRLKI